MSSTKLPIRAGAGFKPEHAGDILEDLPDVGWFEVHAENYMGRGGPPHHMLRRLRERYPLSLHGVGLSIGTAGPLDRQHLDRLKALIERYEPAQFSEHLAWSSHSNGFLNDLLPLPYTNETLRIVSQHIAQVQDHLGVTMLLENPATYVSFQESTWDEIDFLKEIVLRTGCGLLLDVNNVFVSCTNHGRSPGDYVDAFPLAHVGEIHLAGHDTQTDDTGAPLLIDTHDRHVPSAVWQLYARILERGNIRPTLIEWDNDLPAWHELHADVAKADGLISQARHEGALAQRSAFHVVA